MTVTFHLESFNIVQVTSNSFPKNVFDMLYKPEKVQGRKDLVCVFNKVLHDLDFWYGSLHILWQKALSWWSILNLGDNIWWQHRFFKVLLWLWFKVYAHIFFIKGSAWSISKIGWKRKNIPPTSDDKQN